MPKKDGMRIQTEKSRDSTAIIEHIPGEEYPVLVQVNAIIDDPYQEFFQFKMPRLVEIGKRYGELVRDNHDDKEAKLYYRGRVVRVNVTNRNEMEFGFVLGVSRDTKAPLTCATVRLRGSAGNYVYMDNKEPLVNYRK